jgi:hypothetical protein
MKRLELEKPFRKKSKKILSLLYENTKVWRKGNLKHALRGGESPHPKQTKDPLDGDGMA